MSRKGIGSLIFFLQLFLPPRFDGFRQAGKGLQGLLSDLTSLLDHLMGERFTDSLAQFARDSEHRLPEGS